MLPVAFSISARLMLLTSFSFLEIPTKLATETLTTALAESNSVLVVERSVSLPLVSISTLPVINAALLLVSVFSAISTIALAPLTITLVLSTSDLLSDLETMFKSLALTVASLTCATVSEVLL